MRKAFKLYSTGNYTLDQLTAVMQDAGLTNRGTKNRPPTAISRAQWHRLLRNPIFTGTFRFSGEMYEGKHEPIITRSTFDAVQRVISRRSKLKAPKVKPYLYRGTFRCGECGCQITIETQKGHNYLRCTKRVKKECSQPYVREESVTEQIAEAVYRVAVPVEWSEAMLVDLSTEQAADAQAYDRELATVVERRRQIDQKLDRLLSAHLDGDITPEEYRAAKGRIVADKQCATEQMAALTTNRANRFEPVTRFVKALQEVTLLASGTDAVAKRDFLKKNGSNQTVSTRRLHWEPREAWKLVENHGPFAHQHDAPAKAGASSAGETCPMFLKAERGRFLNTQSFG